MLANSLYPQGIAVVLGSFNRIRFIKATIKSIRDELKYLNIPSEIIVIDGGSNDGTLSWLTQQKDIVTIVQHNRGIWNGKPMKRKSWGHFMNLAFRMAKFKYICMLSDDCLVVPHAIKNGIHLCESQLKLGNNIGAMAFYFRNWSQEEKFYVQTTLGDKLFVNHGIYLKQALETINYIDETTYQFYCADGDLCLRLWKNNYQVLAAEDSYIEHYPHANPFVRQTNIALKQKDLAAYKKRWTGIYFDAKKPFLGRRIEKIYQDKSQTYKRFGLLAYAQSQWFSFVYKVTERLTLS